MSLQNGISAKQEIEIEDCKAYMYTQARMSPTVLCMITTGRASFLNPLPIQTKDFPEIGASWLSGFLIRKGNKADAESIGNDFLDIIRGPKGICRADCQEKKKKG